MSANFKCPMRVYSGYFTLLIEATFVGILYLCIAIVARKEKTHL